MYEYICQECGQGTVKEEKITNYKTKIKGYPFIVPEATVGICDKCHAEHFALNETKRWEEVFCQSVEKNRYYLLPQDIENIRKALGLTMENFALLIGSTRQSLYNWEDQSRVRPQSRMADLLIKLVERSRIEGKVDVVDFLIREVKNLGIILSVQQKGPEFAKTLILKVKQVAAELLAPIPSEKLELAAAPDTGKKISIVETEDGKIFGKLKYNYQSGSLILESEQKDFDVQQYRFELVMNGGDIRRVERAVVENGQIIILEDSEYTDRHIKEIHFIPKC